MDLELNYYEKDHNRISLANILKIYDISMVLCNNIVNVDYEIEWDDYSLVYDEENDYPVDIYQYFITYESGRDLFRKLGYPTGYSNVLDVWIIGITHFGTGWDYILTDIPIEDFENWFSNYEKK